ncbi:tetratricopeptide repeat protein [bacterium]|nr:tetratricopeptide repeat protein [bacterium]
MELLEVLKNRYPNNQSLMRFQDDLQMRLSFQSIADTNKKVERKNKIKATFKLSLFAVFGTLVVLIVAFFSYIYFNDKVLTRQNEQEAIVLASLNGQAEELLNVGKPNSALQIIEKIREIDPNYSNLANLTTQTENLLAYTAKYDTAQELLSEGNSSEALAILKEIDSENPGLWDVRLLIDSIETATQVDLLLTEAETAYGNQNWDQAITAYENAIQLESDESSEYTEQLLNSYLNQIVAMLQNENTTVEEIDKAQEYYRKAMALAPQSKTFENEREELQSISASLLEQKYAQTAKALLEDKNQDEQSLAKAVALMRKGEGIDPDNDSAQIDLQSAEAYQLAFSSFLDQDWIHSVENLETVYANNPDFANGNATVLLYESYFALGMQYYNANFNQDALKYFEQAEILAWDDTSNPAKLFQVQTYIGHTLGRIGEYENAVSYYEYALESIQFSERASDEPVLANQYAVAAGYNSIGDYDTAYTTYTDLFNQVGSVYSNDQVAVEQGVLLAFFASEHQSTVALIIEANDLPNTMVAPSNQILTIPTISG